MKRRDVVVGGLASAAVLALPAAVALAEVDHTEEIKRHINDVMMWCLCEFDNEDTAKFAVDQLNRRCENLGFLTRFRYWMKDDGFEIHGVHLPYKGAYAKLYEFSASRYSVSPVEVLG